MSPMRASGKSLAFASLTNLHKGSEAVVAASPRRGLTVSKSMTFGSPRAMEGRLPQKAFCGKGLSPCLAGKHAELHEDFSQGGSSATESEAPTALPSGSGM